MSSEQDKRGPPHLEVEGGADRDVYCNGERLDKIDGGLQHIELEQELDNGYTAEFTVGYDGTIGVGAELYKFPVPDPVAETDLECTDGEPRPTFEGELRGEAFTVEIVKRDEPELATDGGQPEAETDRFDGREPMAFVYDDHPDSPDELIAKVYQLEAAAELDDAWWTRVEWVDDEPEPVTDGGQPDGEVEQDDVIRLKGGGPKCPNCGGPTYLVGEGGEQPWWCPDSRTTDRDGCNLRVADDGTARGYDGGGDE